MIIHLSKLSELFKLTDPELRQIKIHTSNKVIFINEDEVEIIDDEFNDLIKKILNDKILDSKEVCEIYSISTSKLQYLIHNDLISYFKLHDNGKYLFLLSDLEKSKDFIIQYSKSVSIEDFIQNAAAEIFIELYKNENNDKCADVIKYFYIQRKTLEEISDIVGLTRERVRQIRETAVRNAKHKIKNLIYLESMYNNMVSQLESNKNEIESLKQRLSIQLIKTDQNHIIHNEFLYKNIHEFNLSVRLYNTLKAADIKTMYDIIEYHEDDLLKLRNFGKKTLDELKELLSKHGLSLLKD